MTKNQEKLLKLEVRGKQNDFLSSKALHSVELLVIVNVKRGVGLEARLQARKKTKNGFGQKGNKTVPGTQNVRYL